MRVNSEHEAEDAVDVVQSQDQLQARESTTVTISLFIRLTVETRRRASIRVPQMGARREGG